MHGNMNVKCIWCGWEYSTKQKNNVDNVGAFGRLCDACCTGQYTAQAEFTSVHIVEFVGTTQRAVSANFNDANNLFVKTTTEFGTL